MSHDWSRATVLSTTEFEVCWEVLGLGETPWQLEPPRSGITLEERRAVVEGVAAGLARRGLGDHRGPRPDVAEQFRLLARPARSFDIRFRADALVAGVAACRGSECVLAVRHGHEIALLGLPAETAAASLVDLIGPAASAPGREIRLPAATLDAARTAAPRDPDRFADELCLRGLPRGDALALVHLCRHVDLRGQLGASAGSGDGSRMRRAPYVIGFHRGPAGLVRQVRHGDTVSVGPTSRDALLAELDELAGPVQR